MLFYLCMCKQRFRITTDFPLFETITPWGPFSTTLPSFDTKTVSEVSKMSLGPLVISKSRSFSPLGKAKTNPHPLLKMHAS